MTATLLFLWAMLALDSPRSPAQKHERPSAEPTSGRVVVELTNGYQLEGELIESDDAAVVIAFSGGEMRLDRRRIRSMREFDAPPPAEAVDIEAFVEPKSNARRETREAERPSLPSAERGHEFSVVLRDDGLERGRLFLGLPQQWRRVLDLQDDENKGTPELADGDPHTSGEPAPSNVLVAYAGAIDGSTFRVEQPEGRAALWDHLERLRQRCRVDRPGFVVRSERFGNRWRSVRTWELEFTYREDAVAFTERRLYLDFGYTTRIVALKAPRARFSSVVSVFERSVAESRYVKTSKVQDPDASVDR